MDFDKIIERRGTNCNKWDLMHALHGVSSEDGLAMWVADMDFRAPDVVNDALRAAVDHGVWGYSAASEGYLDAIRWWMAERHGWSIERAHVDTAFGVVNGIALCLHAFTAPGEAVAMHSPVYHEFAYRTKAAGRRPVELPLRIVEGQYRLDAEAWEREMTGAERILILCSPHNPGGRVWTVEELREVADFARRHDLIVISDEIHADLVYPGAKHVPLAVACPEIEDRLVTTTSASKTFNVPGLYCGNVIIKDPSLRSRFRARKAAMGIGISLPGMIAAEAAYSPDGAAWADALVAYLDGNRKLFDAGVSEIPGVRSMPLEATYLAWVDFSGTGMEPAELTRRVEQDARIAVSKGHTFGKGGEMRLRFNFGTQRSRVAEAVERLQVAFADLQ